MRGDKAFIEAINEAINEAAAAEVTAEVTRVMLSGQDVSAQPSGRELQPMFSMPGVETAVTPNSSGEFVRHGRLMHDMVHSKLMPRLRSRNKFIAR